MEINNILDQVGRSTEPSFGEDFFRAKVQGQTSESEYNIANAVLVADHLYWYQPECYSPLLPILKAYALARGSGARDRDVDLSHKAGQWFRDTQKKILHNNSNKALLLWALEKTSAVALETKSQQITNALEHHSKIRHPVFEIEIVLKMKLEDSYERDRS